MVISLARPCHLAGPAKRAWKVRSSKGRQIMSGARTRTSSVSCGPRAREATTRAEAARRRAAEARQAAQRATTDYARHAHERVADVHAQLALSHDDFARRLRLDADFGARDDAGVERIRV